MAPPLRLGPQHRRELNTILATEIAEVQNASQQAEITEEAVISVGGFRKFLSHYVDEPKADALVRQLLSLGTFQRRQNITPSETIESLNSTLEREWPQDDFDKWKKQSQYIEKLLSSKLTQTVVKAFDLSGDYENIYKDARVLTDVRPVFDDDTSVILGAFISSTLRIEYIDNQGTHGLSLALDVQDLKRLRNACDRALGKAEVLAEKTRKDWKVETIYTGEAEHELS